MKIAVTSTGGSLDALVHERFGRSPYFVIYDTESGKFQAVSNLGEQMSGGAGPKAAEIIIKHGAEVLITGSVGDKAEEALRRGEINMITGYNQKTKVRDAIDKYLSSN